MTQGRTMAWGERLRSWARTTGIACLAMGVLVLARDVSAQAIRTSAFAYDGSTGLLVKEIVEPDSSTLCVVQTYHYDAYGNKDMATTRNCGVTGDPTGVGTSGEAAAPTGDPVFASRTSSTAYDARGQFATSVTNALTQSETRTYNADYGTVASLTGPNGLTTSWSYDSFGRKTLETRSDGTKTRWDYQYCQGVNGGSASCPTVNNVAGAYVVVTTPLASDGVTQIGPLGKTYYDGLNREIRSETQGFDGTGSSTAIYKDTWYDSQGRIAQVSRPYYSGQSIYYITYTYDVLGRVVAETQPDNSTTTSSYNGLSVTITNANNQSRTTVKNSQGQVVSVTDATGNTLTYQYDPFGNLANTFDALGNQSNLLYDVKGRKTQMNDRDMGVWTYAYNALGELVRQTDAKGQVTTLAYDKLGRMINRTEADLIANWYYDAYKGGSACSKGIGKLCQSETSTGYNKTISYDSQGRYSSASTKIDTVSPYVDQISYDAAGRVLTRTYPNTATTALSVKYVYTTLGYLKEVRDYTSNALYWQASTLDAEGHLVTQTYGNGVITQQNYNAANGRITGILSGSGNAVESFSYTYDSLGNILTRGDANQNLTESFGYDSLNRLTSASVNSPGAGLLTTTYAYNAIGNLTSRSDLGSYSYPGSSAGSIRPHAVSQVTMSTGNYLSYAYDANGNLTSQSTTTNNAVDHTKDRTYVYTSFNMPNSLGANGISEAYYYGPDHERVEQISSSARGATIYLNPGNDGQLFYERDVHADNSVEQRNFITAYGMAVAIVKYTTVSGNTTITTRYMHRDNLGSVTVVTDESGAVLERLAYEPYGKRRFVSGANDPTNSIVGVNTVRGFTNHEMIDELTLVQMNGRIYDPVIGRFISADPYVQDPLNMQAYNRYAYCLGNPVICMDPSGYKSWWTKIRSTVIRVVAAVADAYGCDGYCSAAVGGYQGYQSGGWAGAVVGSFGGYYSFQFSVQYPMTTGGTIDWGNVAIHASFNAAVGCAGAEAAGGNCGRGAAAGAVGAVGNAYGFMGSVIAGCAAGKISGGSCRDGVWEVVGTYAVSRAASGAFNYILKAAEPPSRTQLAAADTCSSGLCTDTDWKTGPAGFPIMDSRPIFRLLVDIGRAIGNGLYDLIYSEGSDTASRPPADSKPIDETPWSGDHQGIKVNVGAGPRDNVRISPADEVWVQNPDGGWTNHGPAGDYTGSGRPSGRRGKDRDSW